MNCRTARKLVQERHDGTLPAAQGNGLQEHLHLCTVCSRLASQFDLASQWLRDLPLEQPSDNFDWRLKLKLSQAERDPVGAVSSDGVPNRRIWTLQFAFSTAAAAVLVVATGFFLNLRHQRTSSQETQPWAEVTPSWAPGSGDAARSAWPRIVPVRSGAPLGPEREANAKPSILGNAAPDTTFLDEGRKGGPIPVVPVRY